MDTVMLIAFCVFAFLVGVRIKQRFSARKQEKAEKLNKNQRPKAQQTPISPEVKAMQVRREKRTRVFTIILLFVLGGLMIYMIPALIQDFMLIKHVESHNIFLRCLIFVFTIYIFILGYIKVFGKNRRGDIEK